MVDGTWETCKKYCVIKYCDCVTEEFVMVRETTYAMLGNPEPQSINI